LYLFNRFVKASNSRYRSNSADLIDLSGFVRVY
jgi:hypothetical protein